MEAIPPSVIGTASPILAEAYTHAALNTLFMSASFPGDPPESNKIEKCRNWLRRANTECQHPLAMFGRLIAEFMDVDHEPWEPGRERIRAALANEGLSYNRGGHIHGATLSGPSHSLADKIKSGGIQAIEIEYDRAYKAIESDPGAAITAACAILETVCKSYLEAEGHGLPSKQVLGALWPLVANHLGLSPKDVADDDLKRILQGLYSIGDGVAALRTHKGSAHGHADAKAYRLAPRHARLAVHAAHTMALFILETWEERRRRAVHD
jgi:Abortive infection C-terminus